MAETTGAVTSRLDDTRERIAEDADGIRGKIFKRGERAVQEYGATVSAGIQKPKRLIERVATNPLGMAVGAMAVGWLAGTLAPSTKLEKETLGETSSQVKKTAEELGREAIERGRDLASETIGEMRTALTPHGEEGSPDEVRGTGQPTVSTSGSPGADPGSYGGINPTTSNVQEPSFNQETGPGTRRDTGTTGQTPASGSTYGTDRL